jgi:hypothetical protein
VIKTDYISFLKLNRFEFGNQKVTQFVVFECKWLGSIIFFYFHKSNEPQDRFHTHAFNALSFKLFGEYDEHILDDELTGKFHIERRTQFIKYFPRNSYNRIENSNGCCTLLFSGPWKKYWKEYINGDIVHYSWGRKKNKK